MVAVVSLLLASATAGCWADGPDPPGLGDPLAEVYRIPSPVPAPDAGRRQWAFTDVDNGLVAQGRRLASLDFATGSLRWAEDLPAAYAVTAANPPLVIDGQLVLRSVTGTSVRGQGAYEATPSWERKLPGRGQVLIAGSGPELAAVHSRCDARGCDLTAVLLASGKRAWQVRTPERVTLVDGGGDCHCLYTVGRRTIAELSPLDGRRLWSFPTPPGPAPVLQQSLYRLTVITPPVAPDCRVTLRGLENGKQMWTRELAWRDEAVEGPCGFDPSRVLERYGLLVPGPGRLTLVDDYHGTLSEAPLRAGEQLVLGGLVWSAAGGYRQVLDQPVELPVPGPDSGRPWAGSAGGGWLLASGPGVVLFHPGRGIRHRFDAATAVVTLRDERLIYQVGDQLVALGPQAQPEPAGA